MSWWQKWLSNSFNFAGTVDLRYKLGLITHKYQLTHRNLADGYPHYINITRHNRTIKSQVGALQVLVISTSPPSRFPTTDDAFCFAPQVDYMEPIVDKITLVEDARFDSPKSMFLGRVMGMCLPCQSKVNYPLFYHNLFVCPLRGRRHWLRHPTAQRSGIYWMHIWREIQRLRPFEGPVPSQRNRTSGNNTRLRLRVQLWRLPSHPGLCTLGGRPLVYHYWWVDAPQCSTFGLHSVCKLTLCSVFIFRIHIHPRWLGSILDNR